MEQEIQFDDVSVGDQFFDPVSGLEFVKVNIYTGRCIEGGDEFEGGYATFSSDDEVIVD